MKPELDICFFAFSEFRNLKTVAKLQEHYFELMIDLRVLTNKDRS